VSVKGSENLFLFLTWPLFDYLRSLLVKDNDKPDPPMELNAAALAVWNRHAELITAQGRWTAINHDALALYARTLATADELQKAVDDAGVLISGRGGGLVRNPCLGPLAASRADLLRLARAVPLVDREAALATAKFDRWMDSLEDDE
jgi:phage terminase small subunit